MYIRIQNRWRHFPLLKMPTSWALFWTSEDPPMVPSDTATGRNRKTHSQSLRKISDMKASHEKQPWWLHKQRLRWVQTTFHPSALGFDVSFRASRVARRISTCAVQRDRRRGKLISRIFMTRNMTCFHIHTKNPTFARNMKLAAR